MCQCARAHTRLDARTSVRTLPHMSGHVCQDSLSIRVPCLPSNRLAGWVGITRSKVIAIFRGTLPPTSSVEARPASVAWLGGHAARAPVTWSLPGELRNPGALETACFGNSYGTFGPYKISTYTVSSKAKTTGMPTVLLTFSLCQI